MRLRIEGTVLDVGKLVLSPTRTYATVIKEIEEKMILLRSQGAVKPLKMKATEDQIKKGAPASYEVPVTFDTSNFFV